MNLSCQFCLFKNLHSNNPNAAQKERGPEGDHTLIECVHLLLKAKTSANLRPRYVNSLRQYLSLFSKGRENTPISSVSVETVEQWFFQRKEAAVTRASNLGRLSALFGYAFRRGWITENPCKRMERIRIDHKPPCILSPDQAKQLLRLVPNICKPYIVLGLFVGIRPEEAMQLTWGDVDLVRGILTVNYSKTRRRRMVKLEPVAISWLNSFNTRVGKLAPSLVTIKRMRKRLRFAIEWHQDLLRHTAASYLMALHKDAGKVATLLGNSQSILMTHYLELVSEESCNAFWALTPEAVLK